MSIRSAGRSAAKVDVYADEKTAKNSPADKQTFILEFVTDVRSAKSKTHLHAFEIVEREPVLLLAGTTELETQSWISTFRKIFFPEQEENGTSSMLDSDRFLDHNFHILTFYVPFSMTLEICHELDKYYK